MYERSVRTCKPNLVCPDPARWAEDGKVIIYLERSSPTVSSGLPAPRPTFVETLTGRLPGRRRDRVPSGAGRCDLALHPVGFAWPLPSPGTPVRSYRTLSPLTPPTRVGGAGLLSVARAIGTAPNPGRGDAVFPLGSTGPCGVRTFLTADPDCCRRRRSDDPAHTPHNGKRPVCARCSGRKGLSCKKAQRPVWPSALFRGRPFPSSRRRSHCRDPRRR